MFRADRRATEPEWMDGDDVSPADMAACMADLARANVWTVGLRPTVAWLDRVTRDWPPGRAFMLVDVGSGGGDMLRAVARWAGKRGFSADLVGYDINPRCVAAARAATSGARFVVGDATAADVAPDFIVCSLVTHHMDDDAIACFLRWIDGTARVGWFVNDLHRHRLAYHGFAALAAMMRWHPIVRHDGPLSVARGFVRADWERLLARAGVRGRVRWHVPFRWGIERAP